jgi:RND family efflux transporter MFP subunit
MHKHASKNMTVFLGIALSILLTACEQSNPQSAGSSGNNSPPPEVVVTESKLDTIPLYYDFTGTAQALRQVDIRAQVSGFLEQRFFAEGEVVDAGALLYQIDKRPFQATLNQAKADLAAEQANAEYLQKRAGRFQELEESQAVSRDQLDEILAQAEQAQSRIRALQATIQRAKLDLRFTRISAPFSGRMEQTQVYEGDLIAAQETVLTRLIQLHPIHVSFDVSRSQGYRVQRLQRQGAVPADESTYKVEVITPDGSLYPEQGHIDFISADINPLTNTFVARAQIPNPDYVLIPGQYTQLRVFLGDQPNQVVIPEKALVQEQGGQFVYVVDKNNKAALQKIVPGKIYQGSQIIEQGLQGGERIIIEGLQQIRPGMTVKPITPELVTAD